MEHPKDRALKNLIENKGKSLARTRSKNHSYKISKMSSDKKYGQRVYKAADHLRRKESRDYERHIQGKPHSLTGGQIKEIERDYRDN